MDEVGGCSEIHQQIYNQHSEEQGDNMQSKHDDQQHNTQHDQEQQHNTQHDQEQQHNTQHDQEQQHNTHDQEQQHNTQHDLDQQHNTQHDLDQQHNTQHDLDQQHNTQHDQEQQHNTQHDQEQQHNTQHEHKQHHHHHHHHKHHHHHHHQYDGTRTPPIRVTEAEPCTVTLSPGYDTYQRTLLLPLPTEYDSASHDDLSADETYELPQQASPPTQLKTSNWRKVKNVVHWTPFVQTYKRHKYPWVQLAGHQGNFKAGDKQGTIMKKLCPPEQRALERLMRDELRPYVPEYMGLVDKGEQEQYLELQDLLSDFTAPCVMDIKMGVRTYLEEELAKARVKPKLRKDMFDKMVQIDPNAPSDAEQRAQAVTKPRYMVWRETISSTATLGFRIEGVKKSDGTSSKDFKTTRSQEQVLAALSSFLQGCDHAPSLYLKRLKEIRAVLDKSDFFKSHELIGSSLLFVHNEDDAKVWLIDFAKSIPLPDAVSVSHKVPWVEGSHEDGYLIGLENLITLMASLEAQVNKKTKQLADKSAPKTSQSSYIDPVNQVKNSVSKIRTLQNDVLKGAALKLESFHQRTADSCRLTNSSLNSKPLTNSSSGQSSASISSVKILSENNKNAVNLSVSESKVVPDLRSTSVSSS